MTINIAQHWLVLSSRPMSTAYQVLVYAARPAAHIPSPSPRDLLRQDHISRSPSAPRMTAVGTWQQDIPICVNFLVLQNLDFDFEKCCSVTLSPINVYVCLVCGKYFQVG
jgi:hypothetical protein